MIQIYDFEQGCDASVMIASSGSNKAEKDHPDNLSLAGDGFDTVIKAKAAIDAVASCRNKVSCADILTMATRDVVLLVRIYIFISYNFILDNKTLSTLFRCLLKNK